MPAGAAYAALALAALTLLAVPGQGQAGSARQAAPTVTATRTGSAAPRKTAHAKRRAAKQAPEPVVETPPPAPPKPDWPANDPSQPARVNWNGRELTVTAKNASLSQVLREVSSATGVKVEGLDAGSSRDQRIYGSFGPAPARDVLHQLLDGSSYNSIMIGDRGAGNPRELLLTARSRGASAAGAGNANAGSQDNSGQEEEVVEEPEPQPEPEPEPQRPAQGPPPPGARPAQQYLQDLRNQQQQQQMPQPNTPQENPTQTPQN